jgi:MinD-like ATPase involved in chromosome partitioning or flagellar assembly
MPDPASIADVLKIRITAQGLGSTPIGVVVNFIRKEKGEVGDADIMKMLELPAYGLIPYDPEVRKTFLDERAKPVMLRSPKAPSSVAFGKTAAKLSGKEVPTTSGVEKKKGPGILEIFRNLFRRKSGKTK